MAAVTLTGNSERHVSGDLVDRYFTVSGASGSTLTTGQSQIKFVTIQQSTAAGTISLITSFSISGGTITFTSSAPMVTEVVCVTSRIG